MTERVQRPNTFSVVWMWGAYIFRGSVNTLKGICDNFALSLYPVCSRLRVQLLGLWTTSAKRLGYQMIAFMQLVFRDWDADQVCGVIDTPVGTLRPFSEKKRKWPSCYNC